MHKKIIENSAKCEFKINTPGIILVYGKVLNLKIKNGGGIMAVFCFYIAVFCTVLAVAIDIAER
jgi:hypothetical protein